LEMQEAWANHKKEFFSDPTTEWSRTKRKEEVIPPEL